MNEYITRDEFEAFKRHIEQKTDEMKAIRVDVHNVDVEAIRQELKTVSDTWLDTLQEHYTEHKTVLSGHAKYFEEHGKRLANIETSINKMESTQEQILKLLQQKSGE